MTRFIFDYDYLVAILIAIYLLLTGFTYSQTFQVKPYPDAIELTWDYDTTGLAAEYFIFYIQGNDTTQFESVFNFSDGATYEQIKDWWVGSSLYNYFFIKIKTGVVPEPSYVRIGILSLGYDGQFSLLKCIPKCLKVKKPIIHNKPNIN